MSKPTYEELIEVGQNLLKMACDWRPDFLEPDEAKEYDNALDKYEGTLKRAVQK